MKSRMKRLMLLLGVACSCLTLALLRWQQTGECESLRSLGDMAEWVAQDNGSGVCRDAAGPLYQRSESSGYPVCRLAQPPLWLEQRIRAGSVLTWVEGPEPALRVPVLGYSGGDLITDWLVSGHTWEAQLVRPLLARLRRLGLGNVTLLDVGCNIGVYALQAAALGFPVVAVDANARNLARVGLALREPSLAGAASRVDLIWNFIAAPLPGSLVRLNYPADCNIGGATKFARAVVDPVAVMPIGGDALAGLVRTPAIFVKLDAEGGETDFLRTSAGLFANLTVVAVQMEWISWHHTGSDARDIVEFFQQRNYSLHSVDGKRRLQSGSPHSWPTDILWLHRNFSWLR